MLCKKCKIEKDNIQDFWFKDSKILTICKECLRSEIDDWDVSTILPLLQELDIPFIEHEWQKIRKKNLQNNHFNTFGRYVNLMKLKSFQYYKFEHTSLLNKYYDQWQIKEEEDYYFRTNA